MPKTVQYALAWSPEQNQYVLHSPACQQPLPEDEQAWQSWLAERTSFAFAGKNDHLTVRKESRKRGEGYWYGYRCQHKRTFKCYIGRSVDVTPASLEEAACALSALIAHAPDVATSVVVTSRKNYPTLSKSESAPPVAASQIPLLVSKLHPPRLHSSLVERARLLKQLNAGLERKLTLLVAPAGFGKTTLLSQWIAASAAPAVAWVTLDAGDNDPLRFWRYIISACQTLQADLSVSTLDLLTALLQPPFERSTLEAVLTDLLNALTNLPERCILVLEDYHLIRTPQIHESLAFFLDHLPMNLHIAIAARNEPALPLARLRIHGELCELSATDLRFSLDETSTFLSQHVTHTLAQKTLQRLNTRLDGWAGGLRVLAHALQGCATQQEVEHLLATFVGTHKTLQEYFVTEVLAVQPQHLQLFLLSTSVLARLNADLCDAVTGRDDSAHLLAVLEREGLFLETLDESGAWYRYHALFAEAMQQEARHRLGSDLLCSIFQRASRWYEEHNRPLEAIETALQAGDIERGIVLIETILELQSFNELHEYFTLRRWIGQIPEELLRQHPVLCLHHAFALVFIAMWEQAEASLQQIEDMLNMAEQGLRATGNIMKLGELFGLRALLVHKFGTPQQSLIWAKQALAFLPQEERLWRSVSMGMVGMYERLAGELGLARENLLEAYALCDASSNRYFARMLTAMLGEIYFRQGELRQAAEYFQVMLAEARLKKDNEDIAHAQSGMSLLLYAWNDLDGAEKAAQEMLQCSMQCTDEELLQIEARLALVRIQFARGELTDAVSQLTALLPRIQQLHAPELYREILSWQARVQLATGNTSAVWRWLENRQSNIAKFPCFQYEQEELLVARLFTHEGNAQEALQRLEPLLAAAQAAGRVQSVLEIQVQITLAYAALKQSRKARTIIAELLAVTQPENYLRLFLDEGAVMYKLLRSVLPNVQNKTQAAYLQNILRMFTLERAVHSSQAAPLSEGLPEPLSAQELRVLGLLVSGRSNPEIAQELIVSVNTVRTQVQSIYRKLDVNNRVAATAMARHLQLC